MARFIVNLTTLLGLLGGFLFGGAALMLLTVTKAEAAEVKVADGEDDSNWKWQILGGKILGVVSRKHPPDPSHRGISQLLPVQLTDERWIKNVYPSVYGQGRV